MTRLPLPVGIEIEFVTSTHDNLSEAGYGYRAGYLNRSRFPDYRLWTDSTCGFEIVSPVLETDEDLDTLQEVCRDLQAHTATVDERCGLHVHVGVNGYSKPSIERLVQFLVRYEDAFCLLVPVARRQHYYCKRLTESVFTLLNGTAEERLAWHRDHDLRYHWLNLASLQKHGTVEFRLMEGTVDPALIRGWAEFLSVLCYKLLNDGKGFSRPQHKKHFKRSVVKDDALIFHNLLVKSEAFYGNVPNQERAIQARKWASDRFAQMQGYRHKTRINQTQREKARLKKDKARRTTYNFDSGVLN